MVDPNNSQGRVEFLPYNLEEPIADSSNTNGFLKGLDVFIKPFILYKYNEVDYKQQMENVVHGSIRKSQINSKNTFNEIGGGSSSGNFTLEAN